MSSIATSKAAFLLVLLLLCLLFRDAAAEWVETAKLTDSDGEGVDGFGRAVAIDNGILVAGAQDDDVGGVYRAGSATIFELSDGEWIAQQKLAASDAEDEDIFGTSVDISNGIVALGSPWEDDGGGRAGAVYIYEKGAEGVWTERQKLIHSDAAPRDEFGWHLAIQGNNLIVGARNDDWASGSVYIFNLSFSGGAWTQVAKLTASDRSSGDYYGLSVAIDVDTILIGSPLDGDLGVYVGSAYVFQRDGQGDSWTQQAKLTPSDGQSDDRFGQTVAIEGGTIIVGSNNNADGERVGAVYQFGKDGGGTWSQQTKLVPRDFATNDSFGYRLAFRNGNLVVGAWGQNSGIGAVYVFQQVCGVWTQREKLAASDGAPSDYFGRAIAADDGTVFVGAVGSNFFQGSVYAFEWRASETSVRPSVVLMPTMQPCQYPSVHPSATSSILPSLATSVMPTIRPTRRPSAQPTSKPSTKPTPHPTEAPDLLPTVFLSSNEPSRIPLRAASASSAAPSAASSQPSATETPTRQLPQRTSSPNSQLSSGSTVATMLIGVSIGAGTVLLPVVLLFAWFFHAKKPRETAASTAVSGQGSSGSPSQSDIPRKVEVHQDLSTLGDGSVGNPAPQHNDEQYKLALNTIRESELVRHPLGQDQSSPDGLNSSVLRQVAAATSIVSGVHSFDDGPSTIAYSKGSSPKE